MEAPYYYQGRIQVLFEMGNRFWLHENRHPNFARSSGDIILILFNSSQINTLVVSYMNYVLRTNNVVAQLVFAIIALSL